MADANGNGNGHKDSLGVQAYRWILLGGVALLGILSARVLSAVDKTADKVDTLQLQLTETRSTTESRINAHRERLDSPRPTVWRAGQPRPRAGHQDRGAAATHLADAHVHAASLKGLRA